VNEFIDKDRYSIDDIADLAYMSHDYDQLVHNTYLEELEQILQFIMVAV